MSGFFPFTPPLFRLKRGLAASLPAEAPFGEPYFTEDTKRIYVGMGEGQPLALVGEESDFFGNRLDYLEEFVNASVKYEYDGAGTQVITETVKDKADPPNVIKLTEYTYDTEGRMKTETVTRDGRTVVKTFYYLSDGRFDGVDLTEQ